MSAISKRDAMKLVADIRKVNVSAHVFNSRSGEDRVYYFLGGLESVLHHFLEQHGCKEAASALKGAMNDAPTDVEIAARNAEIAALGRKPVGSAS